MYIKLFYKLVGAFLTADGPTAAVEPERRRALHILASLCCFNYQSAAQRQEAGCRDERPRLLSLPELCLMKGKRGPPTMPEGKDPRSERGKHRRSVALQKEVSFSAVPALPPGAAAEDTTSLFTTYGISLGAPNEPEETLRQKKPKRKINLEIKKNGGRT